MPTSPRTLTTNLVTENKRDKREARIPDTGGWVKICPTIEETVPLIPAIDDDGNNILNLAVSGDVEYREYVKVSRCRDNIVHIGGLSVRCEQQWLEHMLVVFDSETGQEKIQRPFLYPSGCTGKIFQPT